MKMHWTIVGGFVATLGVLPGCMDFDPIRCGGLALVGNPPGCPVVSRPTCTGLSWIVRAVHCQDTILRDSCAGLVDPVLDPGASTPQARLRVGEAALFALSSINPTPPDGDCSIYAAGGLFPWLSSDTAVASTERTTVNTYVVVRALSPGDVEIFADGMNTPGGPMRASLAYCPDSRAAATCVPVPLVLRVLP